MQTVVMKKVLFLYCEIPKKISQNKKVMSSFVKEVKFMDKTILGAGCALTALGAGLLLAGEADYNLHQAFSTGGYLWLAIGVVACGLGLKVKREKKVATIRNGAF